MDGLKTSLNKLREISSDIYQKYIPILDADSDISQFATPIMSVPVVMNEFCDVLVNKLVYSQFESKTFNNPLRVLEGESLPLGYAGEHVMVNRAKGRKFNVDDFAGLLFKYESQVKVEYFAINSDLQYPVTISREQLKKAMTSWENLSEFITSLSNSLYNGCYIDEFNFTKNIISGAFKENRAQYKKITAVTDEATAKAFVEEARKLFLNFQLPSTKYNAWAKNGGAGDPITTWSRPEDIVLIIRNDIRAKIDVQSLSVSFNLPYADFLGNVITVDDFDVYDDDGNKIYDGSGIVGMIADKSWFKIKTQDMYMESFANPNNRTIQYYLNVIRGYNMSLFANGVIFSTTDPTVPAESLSFVETSASVDAGDDIVLHVETTPFTANPTLSYSSSATTYATVGSETGKYITVHGEAAGSATITVSDGTHTATISVTVNA